MSNLPTLMVLIPALPLAAALLIAALGKLLGERSHYIALAAVGASCVLSFVLLFAVADRAEHVQQLSTASAAAAQELSGDARSGAEHAEGASDGQAHGHTDPKAVQPWAATYTLWRWASVEATLEAGEAAALDAAALAGTARDGTAAPAAGGSDLLDFDIGITLRADPLTAMMLAMVTFVSLLVILYSSGYMHGDPGYWRFFVYVSLFVFSMTMLVSSSNFVLLYVFWEAVGVCSYLLIGFWYRKPEAASAGKKAFLVNRVGDFGFALGIFLIWTTYGTLDFHDTIVQQPAPAQGSADQVGAEQVGAEQARAGQARAGGAGSQTVTRMGVLGQTRIERDAFATGGVGFAICMLLLLGACGKSAQFPLHVWLPDAMEGPTPVSALIHAATMVTAGVYMVARCTPLFLNGALGVGDDILTAANVVAVVGAFTALLAGLIAVTQNDLKRVLAYSTISQLGYMFLALGTGSLFGILAGLFHLFTHAFFKALLFLGAGSVMHAMGNVIDMRRFGGLRRIMPVTYWTFVIGSLALAGIVPFAGFWSKDAILAAVEHQAHTDGLYYLLYWVATASAFLTAFYTARACFMTFFGEEHVPHEAGDHAHESPPSMTIPLIVLGLCSVVVGVWFGWNHGFMDFLLATPSFTYGPIALGPWFESHLLIGIVSTLVALTGIGIAAYLYLGDQVELHWLSRRESLRPLYALSYRRFYLDDVYNWIIVWPARGAAAACYWFDRWIVDGLINLVGRTPPALGSSFRSLQSGMLQFYAVAMVLGLIVLVGVMLMI